MKKRWFSMGIVLVMILLPVFSVGVQAETVSHSKLDINTARTILQYVVGKAELSGEDQYWLDQNWDGKLDIADARILLQKLVGKWVPEAWTEGVSEIPDGEEIDFRVVRYTQLPRSDAYNPPFQLYVARSLDELTGIYAQDKFARYDNREVDYTTGFDDSFFENQIAIVIFHSIKDWAPRTIVDLLVKDQNRLILCASTGYPDTSLGAIVSWRIILAVDRVDIRDIKKICWSNERINFWDPIQDPGHSINYREFVKNWLNDWLDSKDYIKKEGDTF